MHKIRIDLNNVAYVSMATNIPITLYSMGVSLYTFIFPDMMKIHVCLKFHGHTLTSQQ